MSTTSQEQSTATYPMNTTVEFVVNQICGIASELGLSKRAVQLLRVLSLQEAQPIAERDLVETAWGWEYEETDIFRMEMYFRHIRKTLQERNLPLDLRRKHRRGNFTYRLVPRDPEKVQVNCTPSSAPRKGSQLSSLLPFKAFKIVTAPVYQRS